MMKLPKTQARQDVLKDRVLSIANPSADVSQRRGKSLTESGVGLVLKKGTFFVGSILFSLLLLTLSGMTPTAHAATHQVNHPSSGGSDAIYTHIATAANSDGDYTDLNNPVLNNNPNAFIEVTPNFDLYGVYDDHPIGVWYHNGVWSIFNQDLTPIPTNAAFNVFASLNPGLIHIATAANSDGNFTDINDPGTNGHPEAILQVTPNFSPYGVYDDHPIGVWYHNGVWSIFNQDLTPIPTNAAFNVTYYYYQTDSVGQNVSYHVATTANSDGDYTDLNTIATNRNRNSIVFITSDYDPFHVYNNHNTGVWYHDGVWSIFNQDLAPIPQYAVYDVFAYGF